jgi:hypothetical protein
MDLHPDNTPGLGLPQPSPEQGGSVMGAPHTTHGREIRPISLGSAQLGLPQPAIPQQPAPLVPAAISTGISDTSSSADDNSDALDEEWVSKAKAIVERTKSDPYLESKEISKAKADYLRLRYNKQIKVAEEHS